MKHLYGSVCLLIGMTLPMTSHAFRPDQGDGWGPTAFSNVGGVSNTRHNLSLPQDVVTWRVFMNEYYNDYGDVCVYCHTPHSANTTTQGTPLWNRPTQATSYTVYGSTVPGQDPSSPMASGQTPSAPGPASITCLSSHDGTLAIDAIINILVLL